jgi:hypothetical protein
MYFFLLLWFIVYLSAGDLDIGGKLFGLTPHEMDMINYCGMAIVKGAVVLFFLFPYICDSIGFEKTHLTHVE